MDNRYDILCRLFVSKPLQTKGLILRSAHKKDAVQLSRMYNANDGDYQAYAYGAEFRDHGYVFNPSYTKVVLHNDQTFERSKGWVGLYVVQKQGGAFIGHFSIWHDDVNRLRVAPYLLPSYRGRGILSDIYERVIKRADTAGLFPDGQVYSEVLVGNVAAQKFYLSHQFQKAGDPVETRINVNTAERLCYPYIRTLSRR